MARAQGRLERRLLWASLQRQRGPVAIAVFSVAIGVSVAAALLHVSGDVNAKLTREFRSLGPNLLLTPARTGDRRWVDEGVARERLARVQARGAVLLYATAHAGQSTFPVIGVDTADLLALHPGWRLQGEPGAVLVGERLARRLGLAAGSTLAVTGPESLGGRTLRVAAVLLAGGPEDEALVMPLADAQSLAALPDRVSLAQLRVDGGAAQVERMARELERGGALEAVPLYALSSTEQGLLDRMRRLMALVTIAALVAGALSTYGTLTDLALERRREIALLKAIGAPRRRIVARFVTESVAIGLAGGVVGWAIGAAFAMFIGRQVFHATLALRPEVPPIVILLGVLTAGVAAAGPIQLALAVEPARVLKGE